MATGTITLKEHDAATDVVLSLVGNTATGAEYRVASRSLGLPQSLDVSVKIGSTGSKGNDKVTVTFKNTVRNAATGAISTGLCTLELSIPRDPTWLDDDSKDLLAFVCNYLTSGRRDNLADGIVP